MGSNRWLFLAFLGGSFFILFFNLWGRSLENHDYLRYAEVAKEMIQSGDWVIPRFNGEIFLHKPPLLFWLIALPSKIYGSVPPFLARLPSTLFAWLGGVVVYLWGRKIWGGERYGLISAGILISSYLYFWQGRIARTDMVFSTLILLSLYFFYSDYQSSAKKMNFQITLSLVFIGMAGFTKGPVGIFFPLLIILSFLSWQKQLRRLVRKEFLLGYLIIILMFASWMIPFLNHVGWDTAQRVWNESKILTRHAPFYLYGYRIWIDFAPWSVFLPFMLFYYWEKEKNRDEIFLILWFFGLFCLLTLFPYRASKYLLPAFPALALLMGGFWRNRSTVVFWVFFFGAIVVWHGYEFKLVQGNEDHVRGIMIEKELKSFRKDIVFGYRIDIDILGKINFYGDPIIPQVNTIEDLKRQISGEKEVLVITPQKGIEDLIKEGFRITPIKIIEHKDMSFVLTKIR